MTDEKHTLLVWNDEHFLTEGTVPDAAGTVCGCLYCCACREINRLQKEKEALAGQLEATRDELKGKIAWALMLKADLNTAMNQRDEAQRILRELTEQLGCEDYLLPSKVEKLKQEVEEMVSESIAIDTHLVDIWKALEGYDRPMLSSLGLAMYVTRMREQLEGELAKSDRKGYEEFQRAEFFKAEVERLKGTP